jgi:hypothetical protein
MKFHQMTPQEFGGPNFDKFLAVTPASRNRGQTTPAIEAQQ